MPKRISGYAVVVDHSDGKDLEVRRQRLNAMLEGYTVELHSRYQKAHSRYMEALRLRREIIVYRTKTRKGAEFKLQRAQQKYPNARVFIITGSSSLSSTIGKANSPFLKSKETPMLKKSKTKKNAKGKVKTKTGKTKTLQTSQVIGAPGKFRDALFRAALASGVGVGAGLPTLATTVGCSIITAQKHLDRMVKEKTLHVWQGTRGKLYGHRKGKE
jgi:hypothetical protein